jgi:hypothetical protein
MSKFLQNIPILGGFFDDTESEIEQILAERERQLAALPVPTIDDINLAPAVTIQEDPRLIDSQRRALERLAYLGEQGFSEVDQAALEEAALAAQQNLQANTMAIQERAARQGMSQGGQNLALNQMAAQSAANMQRQQGTEAAAQNARQRALMSQAYLGGLGDFRSQGVQTQARNADILNNFNNNMLDLNLKKRLLPVEYQYNKFDLGNQLAGSRGQNLQAGSQTRFQNRDALLNAGLAAAGLATGGSKKPTGGV